MEQVYPSKDYAHFISAAFHSSPPFREGTARLLNPCGFSLRQWLNLALTMLSELHTRNRRTDPDGPKRFSEQNDGQTDYDLLVMHTGRRARRIRTPIQRSPPPKSHHVRVLDPSSSSDRLVQFGPSCTAADSGSSPPAQLRGNPDPWPSEKYRIHYRYFTYTCRFELIQAPRNTASQ